jgi:hypothetical protein
MVGDFFWDLPIFAQMSEQTTGIVIMAFGKAAYHEMAYNFALSVKHFDRDLPIQLICDKRDVLLHHKYWVFDIVTLIDEKDIYTAKGFSPGRAKTRIDKYMAFDNSLYFDIDGVALKSLKPLVEKMLALPEDGYYYVQSGELSSPTSPIPTANLHRDGARFGHMIWAGLDTIWEYHEMPDDAEITAINSSFMFLRKGDNLTKFFNQVRDNIDNGIPLTKIQTWGNTYPDELAFNIACGQFGLNPWPGINPIYFHNLNKSISGKEVERVMDEFYVLGLFGGGTWNTHATVWEMSCNLLGQYHTNLGLVHEYKWHTLARQKHAGLQKMLNG